jgi:hypothetical protein
VFLLAWTAKLIAWAELWPLHIMRPQGWSPIESGAIGIGVMGLLAFTSLQSVQTTAKLALFMNKLGAAILIAALIRVHHGWPAVLTASPVSTARFEGLELWPGLSEVAFYVAPLVFFAANFGYRSAGRKTVGMTGLMGIAVPLARTLLLVGMIGIATIKSGLYLPSMDPNVAMALWSHAASGALLGRMMLAAISSFGAIRFGIRALVDSASIRPLGSRWTLVLFGFLAGAIVLVSADPYAPTFGLLTNLLAVVPAVLTADFVTRSWRVDRARRLDWIGTTALLAGLTMPLDALIRAGLDCGCGRRSVGEPVAAALLRSGVPGLPVGPHRAPIRRPKIFLTLSVGKHMLTVSDSLPIGTARRSRRCHPARYPGPPALRPAVCREIGCGVPGQPPRNLPAPAGSEAGQPRYR